VSLDDLAPPGPVRAAAILGPSSADSIESKHDWDAIEASMAGRGEKSPPGSPVAAAREWLLAGDRTLTRVDRRRRFAASVGGRVVAGELARVWIASGPDGDLRAVVGIRDRTHSDLERRAAARGLGLPEDAVAALVYGPELVLVVPIRPGSADRP
jgi:hypothetical protein